MSLIYPRYCEACGENLFKHELYLCNACLLNLPKNNFYNQTQSELDNTFVGRVPLKNALSFYVYQKCGRVQKLLHAIKYHNQKELGEFVGNLYAQELNKNNTLHDVDFIVPIPLHKNKLRTRGYNQSEWFAKGLSAGLLKPIENNILERVVETSTQTKKRKYQRWENVEGIFKLTMQEKIAQKHILLVDDVITTGATIEAAWLALKDAQGLQVSVASIAFAGKSF
jgi:ComF family protein